MGAGDRQHVSRPGSTFRQPLRAAGVAQAGVEHRLDRRIAARQRVADDDSSQSADMLSGE